MLKSQANSEQFQTRSANHSTKGSRKGFSLLGGGEDPTKVLTIEEQRDSLKVRLFAVKELRRFAADKDERKRLGVEILDIQNQISALRAKRKSERPEEIPIVFVDICRERMSKHQFRCIMDEANDVVRRNAMQNEIVRKSALEPSTKD